MPCMAKKCKHREIRCQSTPVSSCFSLVVVLFLFCFVFNGKYFEIHSPLYKWMQEEERYKSIPVCIFTWNLPPLLSLGALKRSLRTPTTLRAPFSFLSTLHSPFPCLVSLMEDSELLVMWPGLSVDVLYHLWSRTPKFYCSLLFI